MRPSAVSIASIALFAATACVAPDASVRPNPIDASDARLTRKPTVNFDANPQVPQYPKSARDERIEGEVVATMCVSAQGVISDVRIVGSSGDERLDKASVDWLEDLDLNAARIGDEAVAVCGHQMNVVWTLNY